METVAEIETPEAMGLRLGKGVEQPPRGAFVSGAICGAREMREAIKTALLAEAETYRLPESAPIRDALRAFAARLGGAS